MRHKIPSREYGCLPVRCHPPCVWPVPLDRLRPGVCLFERGRLIGGFRHEGWRVPLVNICRLSGRGEGTAKRSRLLDEGRRQLSSDGLR